VVPGHDVRGRQVRPRLLSRPGQSCSANRKLEQKLIEQGGTVAWANVVDAKTLRTSGWNYENGPYTVDNKVIFDPNDHDKVAILDDEIFPPGLSHEQTERSAQRHRELEQATKDGKLAEYIQEQVRQGQAQAASGGQVLFSEGGPAFVVHPEDTSAG
jgi:hypothetical protein